MIALTQKQKNARLYSAVREGNFPATMRALKKGGDPNFNTDNYDKTTIAFDILRCFSGDNLVTLLSEMVARQLDLTHVSHDGCLLHQAVKQGHMDAAQCLLDHGMPANLVQDRYSYNHNALDESIRQRQWDFASQLIEAGALQGANGKVPHLDNAIRCGAPISLVEKIADHEWRDAKGNRDPAALHSAAQSEDLQALTLLINTDGVNVNDAAMSQKGKAPLHTAAGLGKAASVKRLLELGAVPDALDDDSNTPLWHAVSTASQETTRTLIDHMDEDTFLKSAPQAMVLAASKGYGALIQIMVDAGADVKAVDGEKKTTPLMAAAAKGQLETVEMLLKMGADGYAKDASNMTAYGHALAHKKAPVIMRLSEFKQPDEETPFDASQDDQSYKKLGAYTLEVSSSSGGLTMVFNFWTQQVTHQSSSSSPAIFVQNFRDIQRQQVVQEARNQLISLGGTPPDIDTDTEIKKPTAGLKAVQP